MRKLPLPGWRAPEGRARPGGMWGMVVSALVAAGMLVSGCAYESAGTTTTTAVDPGQVPPTTGPAALVFEDQLIDGSAVVVGSVTLPAEGFVVLQADAVGAPGEVVGVSEVIGRGTVADVVVPLFLPLDAAAVLHATLHVDMDRDGRFLYEPPDSFVDSPATSGAGEVATASAEVGLLAPLAPAAVALAEQRTDGGEVVVAEVTLPAPGFIALQADEDGVPGAILGLSSRLPEGTTRAVAISLDEPGAGVQTMFAVAYIDRDGDGVAGIREVDSPDEVAQAFDGGPARASAEITVVLVAPADLEVEDQEGDGTAVVVASVTLPSPGFLEVRIDSGGSPGRRLAVSELLPTGTSTDVEIELGRALAADAVLWVRVRIDFDGDGAAGDEDRNALDAAGQTVKVSLAYTLVEGD
ncbi:MAG TPA: hypothetical protein VMX37_06255 [Acidimicrobiia bacterium]|nr:hypothetical protein [Acidimicrobiia bacterium]